MGDVEPLRALRSQLFPAMGCGALIGAVLCLGGWAVARFVVTRPYPAIPAEADAIQGIVDGPTVSSPAGAPVICGDLAASFSTGRGGHNTSVGPSGSRGSRSRPGRAHAGSACPVTSTPPGGFALRRRP